MSELIRKLKKMTGAGITACKNALQEAKDNLEHAVEILKRAAQVKGQKNQLKEAREGKVFGVTEGHYKAIVEINVQTDFGAKSEEFNKLCKKLSEDIKQRKYSTNELEQIREHNAAIINETAGIMNEKVEISDFVSHEGESCDIYIYNDKIGAIVDCEQNPKDVALHVVAMSPQYLTKSDIPHEQIESETKVIHDQCRDQGMKEDIIEKVVHGKLQKQLYEAMVLTEQYFVKDNSKKISDIGGKIHFFKRIAIK